MAPTTATTTSLQRLFARLSIASPPSPSHVALARTPSTTSLPTPRTAVRTMHTTPPLGARQGGSSGGSSSKRSKKNKGPEPDARIVNLKSSMPRVVPAPLRFARNRYLRHWTIHRAWLLFQRRERERREKELARMYQSMYSACEELRLTSGPGTRDEGYLYRVAMEKKGLYGHRGIPIEYARTQTETPAREPWNHDWKR
ncbi:hypothetical protein SLS62_006370 [Diatrype stigma]|uniref:Large ribosomal subunit protein mL40 n=1 Tax=Diatrype stigma TaxID=117547 RepID=A0AAN9UYQ6_9PEZI